MNNSLSTGLWVLIIQSSLAEVPPHQSQVTFKAFTKEEIDRENIIFNFFFFSSLGPKGFSGTFECRRGLLDIDPVSGSETWPLGPDQSGPRTEMNVHRSEGETLLSQTNNTTAFGEDYVCSADGVFFEFVPHGCRTQVEKYSFY